MEKVFFYFQLGFSNIKIYLQRKSSIPELQYDVIVILDDVSDWSVVRVASRLHRAVIEKHGVCFSESQLLKIKTLENSFSPELKNHQELLIFSRAI